LPGLRKGVFAGELDAERVWVLLASMWRKETEGEMGAGEMLAVKGFFLTCISACSFSESGVCWKVDLSTSHTASL